MIFAAATGDVPDGILEHPGMIAETERRALYGLTRAFHRDGQTIVDAGAFLGASTKAFLLALLDAGATNSSIHTYEFGRFSAYSAAFASKAIGRPCAAGESFVEIFKSLVNDKDGIVKYHLGDIRNFEFEGTGISIAFLDVLKSTSLLDAVYDKFIPYFQKDTIVYQQDYFHPFHPWIACSMAQQPKAWSYLGRPDPEFGAFNAAIFEVRSVSGMRAAVPSRLAEATREQVLDLMNVAISKHDHPFEKLCVVGLRSAAMAIFDKDESAAMDDFRKTLRDNAIEDLLDDPRQRHHVNRITRHITLFANGDMNWSD